MLPKFIIRGIAKLQLDICENKDVDFCQSIV